MQPFEEPVTVKAAQLLPEGATLLLLTGLLGCNGSAASGEQLACWYVGNRILSS